MQYPKVGEANSAARVGVVSAAGGPTRWLEIAGDPRNHYIARMEWAANSERGRRSSASTGCRTRDEMMLGDAHTGQVRTVLTERDSTWVDVVDDFVWLDRRQELHLGQRAGRVEPRLRRLPRRQAVRLVTQGDYDVLEVQGIDPKGGWLYYIASPDNPVQRYLFRIRLDGKGKPERLSPARESGSHTYDMAPNYKYAIETYSSLGNPPDHPPGAPARPPVGAHPGGQPGASCTGRPRSARPTVEWLTIPAEDGAKLPGVLMKPADFDSTRKYPLLFFVYGGPGSTEVEDSWGGLLPLAHDADPEGVPGGDRGQSRDAGARSGESFRKAIYGQLGVLETQDQAAAARMLRQRSYVDPARIGIWGWSYGGFMSLNVLFQHPELYRTAVAVSPVTHWRLYDNVYTERFNGLITENKAGYDRGSPLSYVDGIRGQSAAGPRRAETTTCTTRTARC